MTNLFTTATPAGVTTRDVVQIAGALIALLGTLGLLDEAQRNALTEVAPVLFTAIGTVIAVGMGIYRNRTKSSTDKAAEVAKEVDAKVPVADDVHIKTPGIGPDIIVKGE